MAKFKFSIEAGVLYKSQVRIMLKRSADKLMYAYPGSFVTIREESGFLETEFFIQGVNFPDTAQFEREIRNWVNKIKNSCNA